MAFEATNGQGKFWDDTTDNADTTCMAADATI